MAAEATGGGTRTSRLSGKENAKPSFSSKLKKLAVAVPGIVGSSIVEGIGGPKARGAKVAAEGAEKIAPAVIKFAKRTGAKIIADRKGAQIVAEKAARTTEKESPKVVRAYAREAAGPKAKGPGGKPKITRNNKSLKDYNTAEKTAVVERTGTKPGEFKNVERTNKTGGASPERAATATEKTARSKEVTVKRMTAVERTAAKNASDPQGYKAAKAGREAAKPTTVGVKKFTPRENKVVRRARSVDQLGKSSASKIEKKVAAKEDAKLTARANRGLRPSLIAKNKAAVKRVGKQKQADKARQTAETKLLNDKTPVKQYDDKGRVIGSTTKGELRQLKIKVNRAAADTRNSLRGKPQGTIDERTPRPKGLTDREVEILRTVGKRDYSKGEVNTLADKKNYEQVESELKKYFRSPKVRAEDAANERAAIEKIKSDKAMASRAKKIIIKNKKTFRGKAK
jgi:hypothetical protein